jgi:hypothetical protein
MRRLTRTRPSPALVVAVVALVAALVGTAVAADPVATTARLDKKEKKQAKKIARKQIRKLAPGLSVDHANTADSATNAQNADNATNAQNADNATNAQNAVNAQNAERANIGLSPVAWAHVAADGTVLEGRGISSANVDLPLTGHYCISGLEFSFQTLQATLDYQSTSHPGESIAVDNEDTFGECPAGVTGDAFVATAEEGTPVNRAFFVWFFN